MERQRIGEICAKDLWAFAFRCLGKILFPILLLMPFFVVWRIFFYTPEDFWRIARFGTIYIVTITAWIWLTSSKTIFEYDDEKLCIIKKHCFLFETGKIQIPLNEIKQITFAEVKTAKREPTKFEKIFRLKLIYNLMYGLGRFLLNKGKTTICITHGEQTIIIDDIKKNDARYLYVKELQKTLKKENN